MTKRLLKLPLILVVAIIGISFLVPTYPDVPVETNEAVVALNVSNSGERLLLRTLVHDYDFTLPPNRLNELSSARYDRLSSLGGTRAYLDKIRVRSTGMATAKISIMLGGYDSNLSKTRKGILPDDLRADLVTLGFVPSNGNVVGDFDTPLYMIWSTELSGRQYPANSREAYTGVDLTTPTVSETLVVSDDEPALERNRRLNTMLRPLTALRDGVETGALVLFMIIIGANPAPGG
ncbi:hypothetical protein [Rhizobium lusitanum]|uniref:Uncharacterized protein n=1 Tax=Rhizobium lusitanum TaxID=293958 RepID=A0A1C3WDY7_9HYPH|nr:hypothetical protein [Rhizobium lusitanum]SCB38105.1 hypothetical protein GA0061101_110130 [Rhizobium lusitanum]